MRHPDYSDTLLDHFHNPRGAGEVSPADAEATVVSPVHADTLRLTFAIKHRRLIEVRFQCRGCVVAIAAGSVATTLLEGRTIEAARSLSDADVVHALGGVPPGREECSVLVARTVRRALESL